MTNFSYFAKRRSECPDAFPFATKEARNFLFPPKWIELTEAYEDWVPVELLSQLAYGLDGGDMGFFGSSQLNLLHRLSCNPDMEAVWRRIHKRDAKFEICKDLVWCCLAYGLSQSPWEGISLSERKSEHERILRSISQLTSDIDKYLLSENLYGLLTDEEKLHVTDIETARRNKFYYPNLSELLTRFANNLKSDPPYQKARIKSTAGKQRQKILAAHLAMLFKRTYGEHLLGPVYTN